MRLFSRSQEPSLVKYLLNETNQEWANFFDRWGHEGVLKFDKQSGVEADGWTILVGGKNTSGYELNIFFFYRQYKIKQQLEQNLSL